MKKLGYIITGVIIVGAVAVAYRTGIKVTTLAYSDQLNDMQAILAFNHLQRYEELLACLEREKSEDAKVKLEMSIISEKERIARFLVEQNSDRVNEYITLRYPDGLESLKSFESDRGSRWEEPGCAM